MELRFLGFNPRVAWIADQKFETRVQCVSVEQPSWDDHLLRRAIF